MSMLGAYEQCSNGVCQCATCQRKNTRYDKTRGNFWGCCPCMDCQGEPDEQFQDKTDEMNWGINGYATKCERYLPDGAELEAFVGNYSGARSIDWRVKVADR